MWQKMDSFSISSKLSGSLFLSVSYADSGDYGTNNEDNNEDEVLSSLSPKSPYISSKKSKASKSSKRAMTNTDERDDYSGRVSVSKHAASDEREEEDVLVSLPQTMVAKYLCLQ